MAVFGFSPPLNGYANPEALPFLNFGILVLIPRSVQDETNPSTIDLKYKLIIQVPARTSTSSVRAEVGMPLILSLSKDERNQGMDSLWWIEATDSS
jgi:hypothetical protein